ncbi:uncharacterized protein LOC114947635 [Acropora millepora]|uniref:uncharacterized protein LOC114947635 n=1 Tax=Acropora millepora TaxID=45264 RepID=UPI001CF4D815|nr:uncharacterized protein LOC114947635 [Acropora millepora]
MADVSDALEKQTSVSKALAKRKYILQEEDLEGLEFELKDNPVNKNYAPMKIFKLSAVESVALRKWGSMEKLEAEQVKRKQRNSVVDSKIEEEKRHFWDRDEIFEPLKPFMQKLELPAERISPYFKEANNKDVSSDKEANLLDCNIILCFCDCLHSVPPDFGAREVLKNFPEARQTDKQTPFNERKKMGHFSWAISKSLEKIIVNLYVVHKWKSSLNRQTSAAVLNFDALAVALRRFSALVSSALQKDCRRPSSVTIGTYEPYRVNSETFQKVLEDNMDFPIRIFNNVAETLRSG